MWQEIKKSRISAENMVCKVIMKEAGIDWSRRENLESGFVL